MQHATILRVLVLAIHRRRMLPPPELAQDVPDCRWQAVVQTMEVLTIVHGSHCRHTRGQVSRTTILPRPSRDEKSMRSL
jgi:hypothetical protein